MDMKKRFVKVVAACEAVMGFVHIASTFTPVIAGKLEPLGETAQRAFVYMSLMCGAMLVMGGSVVCMLADKRNEHWWVERPYWLCVWLTVINGLLAVCCMPHNPCAYIVMCLAVTMAFMSMKKN